MSGNWKKMQNPKQYLIGNWKMAMPTHVALSFMTAFSGNDFLDTSIQMIIAPSFVTIPPLHDLLHRQSLPIALCAQNCSSAEIGAYTGEVSVAMLQEAGCQYVMIGHSERRTLFGEREPILFKKVALTLQAGLTPIFCIGEPREIYENGRTSEYLTQQLSPYSASLPFVLAYEPIWSIGTGIIPTEDDLKRTSETLRSMFPHTSLLYGGSVNRENISGLLTLSAFDGFLVGGASLKSDVFRDLFLSMKQNR